MKNKLIPISVGLFLMAGCNLINPAGDQFPSPSEPIVTEQPTSSPSPKEMISEKQARKIAEESDCVNQGSLKDTATYNEFSQTWWIDLQIDKPGCNPACVVGRDGTAEINWRCTGLIED